jgi:uncharacterized protein DUF5658
VPLLRETFLLFALNLLDALLTLIWVRNGIATEGNQLMAGLLDLGNWPFITVKLAIGCLAAFVILRWRDLRVARYGLNFALVMYLGLMTVHAFTGLAAFGYISPTTVSEVVSLPNQIAAFFFRA